MWTNRVFTMRHYTMCSVYMCVCGRVNVNAILYYYNLCATENITITMYVLCI